MPFSTPNTNAGSEPAARIHPVREALLVGVGVMAAISLGAYLVYAKARMGTLANTRSHLAGLATWLGRGDDLPVLAAGGDPAQIARMIRQLRTVQNESRDVRRIYFLSHDGNGTRFVFDSGNSTQAPVHVEAARRALTGGRVEAAAWTVMKDLETTAFAPVRAADGSLAGVIGVEGDPADARVSLRAVRDGFLLTCSLAALTGLVSGAIVLRVRRRSARAHRALVESRRIEDAIIATLGEVVYLYDPVSDHLRWRGNIPAVLGFSGDELGRNFSAWIARVHPDDAPDYREAVQAALRDGSPLEREYRVRHADESVLWVLDRARPVHLENGRRILVGSLIDRTTRRTAEEAQRLFFEETGTAHLAIDGDMIVDANPAAVTLFGATDRAALLEQPVWALWPRRQPSQGLSAQVWSDHVVPAIEEGSGRFEWQFRRLDGVGVDCDVFLRATTFQERDVLMLGISDVTPMKQAQARMIESEQRFRDVSEAVGEFIWEVNLEGRYTYASRRVQDVLGVSPDALLGRLPFEFVPEEDQEDVRRRSEEIQATGGMFRNFEHRVRRADGTLIWISVSGIPSYDALGQIVGYRGATLDITQHRAYEQELVLQKNAAEAAGRAKSNFLAMMSHEIRTPLNSVLGFADLLLSTPLDEQQLDYLRTVRSSGDALLVLLNDILDFSKIESGHLEVEFRAADLPGVLRDVIDLHRPNAAAKELAITLDLDPDVPRHVLTDAARLRQILVNLLGNAVKFTPQGRIDVTARLQRTSPVGDGAFVRIVVADTGIGIPEDQRGRLFRPFTQADSSTNRRFGGTGLGLAISKRLAGLLGGDLALVAKPEPGAAFALDLPASIPSAEQIAGHDGPPEPLVLPLDTPGAHPARVLVVDDNALNRRLTTQLLHQLGAQTETAANAEDSYAKIFAGDFDVVLMDVQMPGTDGLQATQEIRRREIQAGRRPVLIVALTADAMVGDRERCLDAGMNDYLTKPLRREALARVIRAASRNRMPA